MSDNNFEYRSPRKPERSIPSRAQRGSFAQNWWGEKWIAALERVMDAGRLRRGRTYARKGQVMEIVEDQGRITAEVQGSREMPYTVTLALDPLTDAQWEAVIDAMSRQVILAAELLAGAMPGDIEAAFREAGVDLFPARAEAFHVSCSCPDWADVCKHIAAIYFLLAERFDEDPFLLFRLRGRNKKQIMDELLGRQENLSTEQATGPNPEADEAPWFSERDIQPDVFWQGSTNETLSFNLHPPDIEMALLKQLGPPAFTDAQITDTLAPVYDAISRIGLSIVRGTRPSPPSS